MQLGVWKAICSPTSVARTQGFKPSLLPPQGRTNGKLSSGSRLGLRHPSYQAKHLLQASLRENVPATGAGGSCHLDLGLTSYNQHSSRSSQINCFTDPGKGDLHGDLVTRSLTTVLEAWKYTDDPVPTCVGGPGAHLCDKEAQCIFISLSKHPHPPSALKIRGGSGFASRLTPASHLAWV